MTAAAATGGAVAPVAADARGVGVTEAVAGSVPDALVPLLAALTFLGSTWFITSVGPAIYLFAPDHGWLSRRDGARVLAVAISALALVVLLKGTFDMPRPPESVMLVDEEGNGFPSGHATGAAAFYGSLAALLDTPARRRRALAAAGLVLLVAFTRVALGVHYLVDVVAGVALGAVFAGVLLALTHRRVVYGFLLGVAIAAASLVLVGVAEDPVAAVGGTAGALAGWWLVSRRGALPDPVDAKTAVAVLVALGGSAALTLKVDASLAVVGVVHAAAGVAFVGLPALQNFSR